MIPKKIHYCWLGGKTLPPLAVKCLESWKKYCPDFEIIRWDESNYDFAKHPYMKQAFDAKKWGFVPDYARLEIIYQHGGIYLDTDVEIIRDLTPLLTNKCFMGFEENSVLALGLGFGAEAGHPILKEMMADYDNYSFVLPNGKLNLLPSPAIQTTFLRKNYALQDDNGEIQKLDKDITIYPKEYLCPYDPFYKKMSVTKKTFTIHHYDGSWVPLRYVISSCLHRYVELILGKKITDKIVAFKRAICNR